MKGFLLKKLLNKQYKNKLLYTVIFFCILLAAFVILDIFIQRYLKTYQTLSNPFTDFKVSSYPVLASSNNPDISASGAVTMDDDSKVVILSKNPNLRFSMASTTKIMTALVALEYYEMDDILSIKENKVEGSVVGFKEGEKISFENLLYAMLLPSANDAALAIAQNYGGGEKEFVNKMNQKALGLHLYDTHFSDSYGFDDSANYTTPLELAKLASTATKNIIFSNVVSTKTKIISNADNSNTYLLNNLNKLLGIDGVNGIKTGYTDEAGGVLVTSTIQKGHGLIIVVMKSMDRFLDTLKILFDLKGNLNYLAIHR